MLIATSLGTNSVIVLRKDLSALSERKNMPLVKDFKWQDYIFDSIVDVLYKCWWMETFLSIWEYFFYVRLPVLLV